MGYPAWAGIDPCHRRLAAKSGWLPRVGGDRPSWISGYPLSFLVTPRGRG